MATITTAEFKPGVVLKMEQGIFEIVSSQHTHTARGSATVRVKMRNVETGQTLERTFQAKEKAEQIFVDRSEMEYLYRDGDLFYFMDPATYEQEPLGLDRVESGLPFLVENSRVTFRRAEGRVLGIELPDTVDLEIRETEPGVRGDTVSGATKPATLMTGHVVQVPLFVEPGEIIKVNTRTGEYLGRVGRAGS
ncbi:MAG: elongation factor P [Planctomycetota bacterium]